jgi:hypothetical protein
MSAQPEPEEDREQQKSKKPAGWFDFIFDFFSSIVVYSRHRL